MSILRYFSLFNATSVIPGGGDAEVTNLRLENLSGTVLNASLENGDTINLSTASTIVAETSGTVASVQFFLNTCEIHVSNTIPGKKHYATQPRLGPYTGIENKAKQLAADTVLSRTQAVQSFLSYVQETWVPRPLDYGVGIYELKVIAWSGKDATGTASAPLTINLEWNNGSSLGLTPSTTNAASKAAIEAAVASAEDFDTITVPAGSYDNVNISTTKKIKLIGAGIGATIFTNTPSWNVKGGLFSGFTSEGGATTAFLQCNSGVESLFLKNIKLDGRGRIINSPNSFVNRGLVVDGMDVDDMTASYGFDFVNLDCYHFNFRNSTFHNTFSSSGGCQVLRIGSNGQTPVSRDLIYYNLLFDGVDCDEDGDLGGGTAPEVHGIYSFGRDAWFERVEVRNIQPRPRPDTYFFTDREAMGGKMRHSCFYRCRTHNGASANEEGDTNLKDEVGPYVLIQCVATSDRVYNIEGTNYLHCHPGYGFNVYSKGCIVGCEVYKQQTEKGGFFSKLYGETQVLVGNVTYINSHVFMRGYNETTGQQGHIYAGKNIGSILDREGQPNYYKGNNVTRNFVWHWFASNSFCPVGDDGTACFSGFPTNWSDLVD